jgi:N-acetylglucosaminyldiphosphoundecaprenol N-acetyl-beta-D-mannosaminyltransferase
VSKQSTYDKAELLGVDIDVLDLAEAIKYICALSASPAHLSAYVIKPYVEFLASAAGKPDLKELLNGAELAIADGVAILWAAHYLYAGPRTALRFWGTLFQIIFAPDELKWPLPERAAGTNFTWPLLQAAAGHHLRVFLIGKDTPGAIELTAATIQRAIPEIIIAGTTPGHDPSANYGSVSPEWLERTTTLVQDAKADLILVGMGFPLQEQVCAQLTAATPHGVFVGEGGTFDYESFGGTRRKAPAAVQHIGLEWLWRLIGEPKRFRRQLAIPRFIYLIWQSRR